MYLSVPACLSAQLANLLQQNCLVSMCRHQPMKTQESLKRRFCWRGFFILKQPKRPFFFFNQLCFATLWTFSIKFQLARGLWVRRSERSVSPWDKATLMAHGMRQQKPCFFQIGWRYFESFYRWGQMAVTASEPGIMGSAREASGVICGYILRLLFFDTFTHTDVFLGSLVECYAVLWLVQKWMFITSLHISLGAAMFLWRHALPHLCKTGSARCSPHTPQGWNIKHRWHLSHAN